jgi:hypothetical protein
MVTLALIAMCGLLGLAVDLGWSSYVQKTAQKAADAAALAAAKKAFDSAPNVYTYNFTSMVSVGDTPVPCSPTMAAAHLAFGCVVASSNGFALANARQNVTIADGTGTPPTFPEAWVLPARYWVTVRTVEQVPQLFSMVLGNGMATVAARATAAVADSVQRGSLWALNRSGDDLPNIGPDNMDGMNFWIQGSPKVIAADGIYLASEKESGRTANYIQGSNAQVTAPWTRVITATDGSQDYFDLNNPTNWNSPVEPTGDGPSFWDPLRDRRSPPLPFDVITGPTWSSNLTTVSGGQLTGDAMAANGTCASYRPITSQHVVSVDSTGTPDFKTFQISGCVKFEGGGVIWGGAEIKGANVLFDSGVYVFAGALPNRGEAGTLLTTVSTSDVILQDTQALYGTPNRGELFIFTDGNYQGSSSTPLSQSTHTPTAIKNVLNANPDLLMQGNVGLKTGTAGKVKINLNGIDNNASAGPALDLQEQQGILFWFDRRNSYVDYDQDGRFSGNLNPARCTNSSASCTNLEIPNPDHVIGSSPEFFFEASNNASLKGIIYQPRGAWSRIDAGANYSGPLQLITGAINMQGSGTLNLGVPTLPFVRRTVSLVE